MRPLPDESDEPTLPAPSVSWTRRRQSIGIVIWSSFLAAAVASVLCFAIVDPVALPQFAGADTGRARMAGYAFGFFMLWLAAAGASLLTLYLLVTARGGK